MKKVLTDKEIREAAEEEKKRRATETMEKINAILKEANCTLIVSGQFQGNVINPQIAVVPS